MRRKGDHKKDKWVERWMGWDIDVGKSPLGPIEKYRGHRGWINNYVINLYGF